ncbi:hypothetical protein NIES3974_29300 [Calothrix sp. NIES-3974]|nr:hypothetical protein NIES3974_29300 [Calothrix sp. NIES-3974]
MNALGFQLGETRYIASVRRIIGYIVVLCLIAATYLGDVLKVDS